MNRTIMTAAAASLALLVLAGCGGDDPATDDGDAPTSAAESSPPTGDAPTDLATAEIAVGWEDAVAAARKDFDGDLAEVGMDTERTPASYKVELVSESEEYKVLVDADSAELSGAETERIDGDDIDEARDEIVDTGAVISWDDALEAAQGEQTGSVVEWKLEGTGRGPRYEFDFGGGGADVEVGVDAVSGEIVPGD